MIFLIIIEFVITIILKAVNCNDIKQVLAKVFNRGIFEMNIIGAGAVGGFDKQARINYLNAYITQLRNTK